MAVSREAFQIAYNVVQVFTDWLSNKEDSRQDQTIAEDVFDGLKFETFDEKVSSHVKKGIKAKNLPQVVQEIAKIYDFPKEDREMLLLSIETLLQNQATIQEFKYNKTKDGFYSFFRFAIVKKKRTV